MATFLQKHPRPLLVRCSILAAILLAWEVLPRAGIVHPIILAPASAVLRAAVDEPMLFALHLRITLFEIVLGLVMAWGLGLAAGVFVGSLPGLRETLVPLASSVYAIPFVVIYPLLAAWFGIGPQSKFLFGGVYGLFPVLLNTVAGIRSIDNRIVVTARSLGATRLQILTKILIPSAMPTILSGLRLGAALVVIGVVVAEMLASAAGIGFLITSNRTVFNSPNVYLAIVIVLAIAGAMDQAMVFLERRFMGWAR